MYPLLPFAVGLVTGALGIRLLKAGKTRATLDKAQERLREATVSSLSAIEHSSAHLRAKLATDAEPPLETAAQVQAAPTPAESKVKPESKAAPRRRRKPASGRAESAGQRAQTEKPDEDKP
ncbi:hypothetical protein [Aromatoleum buckelii]|uniref:Uncharacterized protein n=1 Tax=Aromatoleum buckelii TaxID=200254 RepID=A0ABX1MY72_9RHOO|nr:hypothetical protein [Aromatoleum buckelii]MCK0512359.1 hypothetical protein [Aromatoleum buckelii]